jgi:hypothetical protein
MEQQEKKFVSKIDGVREQLADKTSAAVAYSNDINRLTTELSQLKDQLKGMTSVKAPVQDDGELVRLRALVGELGDKLDAAIKVRDMTVEMGRKAEMTTLMFMQQNADLERNVSLLTQQQKVLLATLEEHGLIRQAGAAAQQSLF